MKKQTGYVSLECCCSQLKSTNPALLGALADQLRSIADPMAEFYPDTIYVGGISDHEIRHPITYSDVSKILETLPANSYQCFSKLHLRLSNHAP